MRSERNALRCGCAEILLRDVEIGGQWYHLIGRENVVALSAYTAVYSTSRVFVHCNGIDVCVIHDVKIFPVTYGSVICCHGSDR